MTSEDVSCCLGKLHCHHKKTHDGTSTDLWCTGSRLFTYGYPYTYIIYIHIIFYYIIYYIIIIYILYIYTTMTFNSNKSRTSHGDLSSWRIKVFAAPVQQLQAIALNESCHLVAQGTGPGSLAPCSTQVLDCFSG